MSLKVECVPLGPVRANTYIVTDSSSQLSAVIDCGGFTPELVKLLDGKKVKYIMLTHGHYDHILGVCELKRFTGAEILIHRDDADCLTDGTKSLADFSVGKGVQKPVTADRLLEEGDEIELGDTSFKVMHTKGHTKGSAVFIDEKDRIMFTGDTLFALTCGRTDLPGGNAIEMHQSLKRLKALEGDYAVYTGHNRSTTLEAERVRNRYLRRI